MRNNKLLDEGVTTQLTTIMNVRLESLRQELQRTSAQKRSRCSRRDQEKHEQIPQQKEAQPMRPREKPNWKSRSAGDKANQDYCSHDVQRSFKPTKPLQSQLRTQIDYEEVHKHVLEAFKAVEKSQKKNPSTTKSVVSEAAKEKPSCLVKEMVVKSSDSNQSLPICKELVVLEENTENNTKEKVETEPYNVVQNQQHLSSKEQRTENETLKCSTSSQAKCTLSCIQSEFVLDELTHSEPVQPSRIVSLSQVLEENSSEEAQRSLPLISESELPSPSENSSLLQDYKDECSKENPKPTTVNYLQRMRAEQRDRILAEGDDFLNPTEPLEESSSNIIQFGQVECIFPFENLPEGLIFTNKILALKELRNNQTTTAKGKFSEPNMIFKTNGRGSLLFDYTGVELHQKQQIGSKETQNIQGAEMRAGELVRLVDLDHSDFKDARKHEPFEITAHIMSKTYNKCLQGVINEPISVEKAQDRQNQGNERRCKFAFKPGIWIWILDKRGRHLPQQKSERMSRRVPNDAYQTQYHGWMPPILIRARDIELEHAKVNIYVFRDPFVFDNTDMIRLSLSREPNAGFRATKKHTRRTLRREEDKRFKPPDLDQDKHQDVSCFILIKEAPPDATYNPKPNLNIQGKYNVSGSFNVSDLLPFLADDSDLRSNPFQVGEDDAIMESTKDLKRVKELVAEDLELGEESEREPELVAEEEHETTWILFTYQLQNTTKKNHPKTYYHEEVIGITSQQFSDASDKDLRSHKESFRPDQEEKGNNSDCSRTPTNHKHAANWNQPIISSDEGDIDFSNRVIPNLPDLDIHALIGGFRANQMELSYKPTWRVILTQPGSSSNWFHSNIYFGLRVIQFLNRRILHLPYLEAHGFNCLQTKLWRPGEISKHSDHLEEFGERANQITLILIQAN